MKSYCKNWFKKSLSLLLIGLLTFGIAMPAFAANGTSHATITFRGTNEGFLFQPGSAYTDTDLFDNFKDVMPGDVLTETITVKNADTKNDYITLYMKAVAHDANGNPLSNNVAKETNLASMNDFLSKLELRVYNGSTTASTLLYDSTPDKTAGLTEFVTLGTLKSGNSADLTVELTVPITLGNEYANRVGEVDWVFQAVPGNNPPPPPNPDPDPDPDPDPEDEPGITPGITPGDGTIHSDTVTVHKIWFDDKDKRGKRPDCITVTLYNGAQAVEQVTLSAANDWAYTWNDLDASGSWSVIESNTPKGYTPAYCLDGNVITITNTATLLQTGQLNWPIPMLVSLGALCICIGIALMQKNRKRNYD